MEDHENVGNGPSLPKEVHVVVTNGEKETEHISKQENGQLPDTSTGKEEDTDQVSNGIHHDAALNSSELDSKEASINTETADAVEAGGQIIFNPYVAAQVDLKGSVNLSWANINVYANLSGPSLLQRAGIIKKDDSKPRTKQVLFNVRGNLPSGSLLAIMGASGAGKTTLMNVLAYQKLSKIQVEGVVKVNKRVIGKQIKSICAYITQDDLFIGTLTVKEHLTFQAMVRMDKIFTKQQRKKRVEEVMTELGLMKVKNSIIGIPGRIRGISGGEARRLAFASEVLTDPSLLFADEPTSGLDSFMAQSVIGALKKMAAKGKTIIATVHQPSSEVFEMFDRLLLMSEGRVAYMGTNKECVPYFSRLGYPCPRNYNPADHYINVLAIKPGEEEECRRRSKIICDHYEETTKAPKIAREMSSFGETEIERPSFKVNIFEQFRWLLWRSYHSNKREPYLTVIRLVEQVAMALIAGLVFLQLDNNQEAIQNYNGAFFFVVLSSTFGAITAAIYVFPAEFPVFFKEHKYGMYRTSAYFFAKTIAELPYYIILPIIFSTISYWMIGFKKEAGAFFIYLAVLTLTNQGGLSFGYAIAALSPSVQVATSLAFPLVLPLFLFGGFFVLDSGIRDFLDWLKYLSWFKYSFEALKINQWDGFGKINCDFPSNSTIACVPNGDVVLEMQKLDKNDLGKDIGLLIAVSCGFRLVALLLLMFKARRK